MRSCLGCDCTCAFNPNGNAAVAETAPNVFNACRRLYRLVMLKELDSSSSSRRTQVVLGKREAAGRSYPEQVLHKIIPPASDKIWSMRSAFAVIHIRHEKHVKVFIRLHQ